MLVIGGILLGVGVGGLLSDKKGNYKKLNWDSDFSAINNARFDDGVVTDAVDPWASIRAEEKRRKSLVEDASDQIGDFNARKKLSDPKFQKMMTIVRQFIKDNDLVVYGGMALNDALAEHDRGNKDPYGEFYDMDVEIPDYDFYSETPLEHAKELADIYFNAGFKKTQAKGGMHAGTYKVFADFEAVADISQMPSDLMREVRKDARRGGHGLLYAGPKFLRVDIHKQLADSAGNVSRWPKVFSRARRILYHYPVAVGCVSRSFSNKEPSELVKAAIKRAIKFSKDKELVIFGATTLAIYKELADKHDPNAFEKYGGYIYNGERNVSDLSVITYDGKKKAAKRSAEEFARELIVNDYTSVQIRDDGTFFEIINGSYTVLVEGDAIITFYEPNVCFSYYQLNNGLRLASFDSSLTLMFANLFKNGRGNNGRPDDKVLCLMQLLTDILEKEGILEAQGHGVILDEGSLTLPRFTTDCYGPSHTMSDIISGRSDDFVRRLMLEKQGLWAEAQRLRAWSYDPFTLNLARLNLITEKPWMREFNVSNDRDGDHDGDHESPENRKIIIERI